MTEQALEPAITGPTRTEPTLGDVVVAAAALFLLIANAPDQLRGPPVLVLLVLWPLGAVGLVSLGILGWRRDLAARWAMAFLAWALVAALCSAQVHLSLVGGLFSDRGWVYVAAYLGCWAVGRRRGASAVPLVTGALVLGLVLNALIALVQITVVDGEGLMSISAGRAKGFTANPVFFGGLMSGGVALTVALLVRGRTRWWWAMAPTVSLLAVGAVLSGSRIGVAGALLFGAAAAWGGRPGLVRSGLAIVAVAVGLVLGVALAPDGGSDRLSGGNDGGGLSNRTLMWGAGLDATLESPIVGWGPNRFRPATSQTVTASFVRIEGAEGDYPDAHNIVVEVLVTTGIPGLVAAAGFGWCAARRARGPLAWYAAGVAVTWLFEPLTDATLPTALLALGVAAGATADPPLGTRSWRISSRTVATVGAAVGLLVAGRSVAIDRLLADASTSADPAPVAARARNMAPSDPAVSALWVQALAQEAERTGDPDDGARALAAAERTAELDPTLARPWVDLGRLRWAYGGGARDDRARSAREAFARAQTRSPWSAGALLGLYDMDQELGNSRQVERWRSRLCAIDACPAP